MYCYNCDDYVDITKSKQKNTYLIHNKEIIIEEECYKCKRCSEELIDETLDASLNKIYDKYLETYNLNINKFKSIRTSLNLSQELFAKALGWSKKTITRYELGQSLPQREYITVYQKLQKNKDEIFCIIDQNKQNMSEADYYKIIKKVNTNMNLKTINVFLHLLDNNPLTQTQIMKYLFATDFENQKELNYPLTDLKYAHAPYGPIIDNRTKIINYLLNNNYIKLVLTDEDNIKFISSQKYDLNLFRKEEIEILEKVKKKLKGKNANELSEWSHNFNGWKNTKDGQIIEFKKYVNDFDLNKGW